MADWKGNARRAEAPTTLQGEYGLQANKGSSKKGTSEASELRLPEKKVLSNNGSTFSGIVDPPVRKFEAQVSPRHRSPVSGQKQANSRPITPSVRQSSTSQTRDAKGTPKKGNLPVPRAVSPRDLVKEYEDLAARYERENEHLKQVIEVNRRHESPDKLVEPEVSSPELRQQGLELERQRKELEARMNQTKTRLRLLRESEEWELKTIEEFRAKKVHVIQHKLERLEARERLQAEREHLLQNK